MQTPTCKLCGAKHWSREPHVFKNVSATEIVAAEREMSVRVSRAAEKLLEPVVEETLEIIAKQTPAEIVPGRITPSVCPTCGHKRPMTNAERVRRHREKLKGA